MDRWGNEQSRQTRNKAPPIHANGYWDISLLVSVKVLPTCSLREYVSPIYGLRADLSGCKITAFRRYTQINIIFLRLLSCYYRCTYRYGRYIVVSA